ncbi:hypothetical protein [Aeromonas sp. HMWF014]|uniref:hypothetical protein n=1 Tax=Aeromonas sp. HMWF014 TaxID=2056850 RepID=UPI0015E7E6F5|nr:hypothetical protein [Aeromonas sp. HMWF014]
MPIYNPLARRQHSHARRRQLTRASHIQPAVDWKNTTMAMGGRCCRRGALGEAPA